MKQDKNPSPRGSLPEQMVPKQNLVSHSLPLREQKPGSLKKKRCSRYAILLGGSQSSSKVEVSPKVEASNTTFLLPTLPASKTESADIKDLGNGANIESSTSMNQVIEKLEKTTTDAFGLGDTQNEGGIDEERRPIMFKGFASKLKEEYKKDEKDELEQVNAYQGEDRVDEELESILQPDKTSRQQK